MEINFNFPAKKCSVYNKMSSYSDQHFICCFFTPCLSNKGTLVSKKCFALLPVYHPLTSSPYVLRNTPLKEVMFQKYLVQVRGWKGTKKMHERMGVGFPRAYSFLIVFIIGNYSHYPTSTSSFSSSSSSSSYGLAGKYNFP